MSKESKKEEVVEEAKVVAEEAAEEDVAEVVNEAAEENANKTDENAVVINNDDNGIIISEEVIASIASIAAQEVKGVDSMNANGIGEVLGRKTKGVKVQSGDKDVIIDITLTVEYGARIPDIAWEVQNRVKTQVETQTGLNVATVNVHVQGINIPKKKAEPAPQASAPAPVEEAKEGTEATEEKADQ